MTSIPKTDINISSANSPVSPRKNRSVGERERTPAANGSTDSGGSLWLSCVAAPIELTMPLRASPSVLAGRPDLLAVGVLQTGKGLKEFDQPLDQIVEVAYDAILQQTNRSEIRCWMRSSIPTV